MKPTIMLIVCLLAIGCATTDDQGMDVVESDVGLDEVICSYEKPIGSHVPRRVCRTRGEIEREAQETRRVLEQLPPKTRTNY